MNKERTGMVPLLQQFLISFEFRCRIYDWLPYCTLKVNDYWKYFTDKTTLTSNKASPQVQKSAVSRAFISWDCTSICEEPRYQKGTTLSYTSASIHLNHTYICPITVPHSTSSVQSKNAFLAALLKSFNTLCSVRMYSISILIFEKDGHCHYQPCEIERKQNHCYSITFTHIVTHVLLCLFWCLA